MIDITTNPRPVLSPKVAIFFAVLLFGSVGFKGPEVKPDAAYITSSTGIVRRSEAKVEAQRRCSKMFGIFINDRHLHIYSDSLDITEKGTLSLRELVGETPGKDHVAFRILLVHRSFAGKILLYPWKEVYQDGEAMEWVDIGSVLLKTQIGEQLIIIPASWEQPLENPAGQFVITVKGNGC